MKPLATNAGKWDGEVWSLDLRTTTYDLKVGDLMQINVIDRYWNAMSTIYDEVEVLPPDGFVVENNFPEQGDASVDPTAVVGGDGGPTLL